MRDFPVFNRNDDPATRDTHREQSEHELTTRDTHREQSEHELADVEGVSPVVVGDVTVVFPNRQQPPDERLKAATLLISSLFLHCKDLFNSPE